MKKIFLSTTLALLSISAMAQKMVPSIQNGTVLNYSAYIKAFDRNLPVTITATELTAPVHLKWAAGGMGSGIFEVSAKAVDSGTKIGIRQPGYDEITKLKDDETLIFVSKSVFNTMTSTKAFELNKQKFKIADIAVPFTLNDKEVDTYYAISENGKTKLWILNNPAFPLICKAEGVQGVDLTLMSLQ
ncbi:hypothetical protein [Mucilaginibacter glaciei]|uniref:DUF3108 domain-containing protein n=1 Tax=Mucilaginibacter glaciei TaxID=2772109 RepID=A0A926S1N0_9SPHI|nr:hypothetical protein [Mucilaginibacter glaciei]MBD1392982.1 hypothetical protein [Mucilaginibacter glaciei]